MYSHYELIFDVVTRDALVVIDGKIHRLDGPFGTREDAEAAADQLKLRLANPIDTVAAAQGRAKAAFVSLERAEIGR